MNFINCTGLTSNGWKILSEVFALLTGQPTPFWSLKIGSTDCSEKSVNTYQSTRVTTQQSKDIVYTAAEAWRLVILNNLEGIWKQVILVCIAYVTLEVLMAVGHGITIVFIWIVTQCSLVCDAKVSQERADSM